MRDTGCRHSLVLLDGFYVIRCLGGRRPAMGIGARHTTLLDMLNEVATYRHHSCLCGATAQGTGESDA